MGQKPGSTNEMVFRTLADIVTENNPGTKFVFEYKPGADGVIANNELLARPADGYSTGVPTTVTTFVANDLTQAQFKKYNWDTFITPVILGETAFALVATASSTVNNYNDFKTYTKTSGKNINIAGSSGTFQLTFDLMAEHLHLDSDRIKNIVFLTGNAIATSVIAGDQTEFAILPLLYAIQFEKSGRLKILAISSENSNKNLSSAPVMVPGFNMVTGYMLVLHPDTPSNIVDWYHREFLRAIISDRYVKYATANGIIINRNALSNAAVKTYAKTFRVRFKKQLELAKE
jgi:tripartite-type tricarboxylate transporter receptor subunit TctC